MPPAGNQVINVTFTPSTFGAKSGNLTIIHNAAGGSTVVPMTGDGTVALSPGSLAFGGRPLGAGASLPLTVTNNSAAPANVTNITSNNPQFTVDITSFPLAPGGGSQVVNVTFTPTAFGFQTGTLSITHNPTVTVPLSGTGLPAAPGYPSGGVQVPIPVGIEWLGGLFFFVHGLYAMRRYGRQISRSRRDATQPANSDL